MVRFLCVVFILRVMDLFSKEAAKDFILKHDNTVLVVLFDTSRM
jgi:hypothetical protein